MQGAVTVCIVSDGGSGCHDKGQLLDPMEFIREAPAGPIAIFVLVVFGFIALAYFIGGKRVLKFNLSETLREDTML